ncbi:unnamed protein product [Adineta ricciae]|uniref:NADAR domain-containing protein n=1 Tax=Adineta ricciae TaxID=249248 RepID=A0A815MG29_ADIRI|nr:unnamed protein product [Adineta ricciae]
MADDLNDDDYYLQEEVRPQEMEEPTEKKVKTKKNQKSSTIKRAVGTYSDLVSTIRIHYKKTKSQYELDEVISIFNSSISAPAPSSIQLCLDEYLNELIPTSKWSKQSELSSAPMVLIIAQSALRCIELGKILKSSSSAKLFTFHYLFAKHKKLSEQIELLNKPTTLFNIIIGTPKRVDDILDGKCLNMKRLKFVLIDWNYQNIKQQRLIDLNQLKTELCHLLCEQKMGGPADIDGKSHPETDNFLPCKFVIDGITYSSAENYFQCAKTTNQADRDMVLRSGPGTSAWAAGQRVKIRDDWESIKVDAMYTGNLAKFQQNDELRQALLSSGNGSVRFTGSTAFWNYWNGLIMERIRAELRQNGETDARRAAEIRDEMEKFARQGK